MKHYTINGVFINWGIIGVTRYAWELISALDKLLPGSDIELDFVIPEGCSVPYTYENIKVVEHCPFRKILWQNWNFVKYLKEHNSRGIYLSVSQPFFDKGIVCIYDVNSVVNPSFFSKRHVFINNIQKRRMVNRNNAVFTISNFSRNEIVKYLGGDKNKIGIVPCAWQHILKIQETDFNELLKKYMLTNEKYIFSLSSMAPTKNFDWIVAAAKHNPSYTFYVTGNKTNVMERINGLKNIICLGKVSDEDAKAFMKNCFAFVFPSIYEGFGMPPLEAIAAGAKRIMVADIQVMHEIFENSVYYIDPYNYSKIRIDEILKSKVEEPAKILKKYSWNDSAMKLLEILQNY